MKINIWSNKSGNKGWFSLTKTEYSIEKLEAEYTDGLEEAFLHDFHTFRYSDGDDYSIATKIDYVLRKILDNSLRLKEEAERKSTDKEVVKLIKQSVK